MYPSFRDIFGEGTLCICIWQTVVGVRNAIAYKYENENPLLWAHDEKYIFLPNQIKKPRNQNALWGVTSYVMWLRGGQKQPIRGIGLQIETVCTLVKQKWDRETKFD